jgi:synaptobrevin family protein YKT6
MKVLSILIIKVKKDSRIPILLSKKESLKHINFFIRGSAREFITLAAKEIIRKTDVNKARTVSHENYLVHTVLLKSSLENMNDYLGAVLVTDQEYEPRIAYSVLENSIKKFKEEMRFVKKDLSKVEKDTDIRSPYLEKMIKDSQDPTKVDHISKIKSQISESVDILHETIEQVLERGSKIERLVEQSEDLSASSKLFYKEAKKQNDCCTIC